MISLRSASNSWKGRRITGLKKYSLDEKNKVMEVHRPSSHGEYYTMGRGAGSLSGRRVGTGNGSPWQREVIAHGGAADAETPRTTSFLHAYPSPSRYGLYPTHGQDTTMQSERGSRSLKPSNEICLLWRAYGGLWIPITDKLLWINFLGRTPIALDSQRVKRQQNVKNHQNGKTDRVTVWLSSSHLPFSSF